MTDLMTDLDSPAQATLSFVEMSTQDELSVELLTEVQQVYVGLYGSPDDSPMTAEEFEAPTGTFLVATDGAGRTIGCIGIRRHEPDVGEIKRMYVRPEFRRMQYGRAMLHAIEERARELGYTALVLETGEPQPEAMALYRSQGYQEIPGFGYYQCAPRSHSFRREL